MFSGPNTEVMMQEVNGSNGTPIIGILNQELHSSETRIVVFGMISKSDRKVLIR